MSDTNKVAHAKAGIKAIELEEDRMLRVIASSPTLDRDLEVIDTNSIQVPVKPRGLKYAADLTDSDEIDLPFLIDHDWRLEKQAGSVKSMYINAAGELEVLVKLSTVDNGERVYTLAKEGHLGNSFSIGYSLQNATLEDGVIKNIEMTEFSGVFKGSNRDARLLAVKSIKGETPMANATDEPKKGQAAYDQIVSTCIKSTTKNDDGTYSVEIDSKKLEKELAKEAESNEDLKEFVETGSDAEEIEQPTVEPKKEEVETPVVEAPVEETPTKEKEVTKMATPAEIAAKGVVPVAAPVQTAKTVSKMTEREKKILTVKQIKAMLDKDHAEVARLNKIAMDNDEAGEDAKAFKTKAISYTEGSGVSLYLAEQLDRDVDRQLTDVGNVGRLVRRIRLTDSPVYRRIVRTDGVRFMKPGFTGVKGEDEPAWTSFTLAPKPYAVIIGWNDHVADDAYINMYDELVKDIAEAEAYLEDETILIEDGATATDGTVYPVQGLVPLLTAAGRVSPIADFGSIAVVGAIAAAYGTLKGQGTISLVCNTATWGYLATSMDGENRPLFTNVNGSVYAGALGQFNVTISDVLEDGQVVIGRYQNYTLADKEGLELLESKHAVVGGINAFTQDYTFLRAVKRMEGGTARINTFWLLEFVFPTDES